jgi:hypothetical protein
MRRLDWQRFGNGVREGTCYGRFEKHAIYSRFTSQIAFRGMSFSLRQGSNSWSTQSLKLRRQVCRDIVLCSNFTLNLCLFCYSNRPSYNVSLQMAKGKNDQSLIASLMSGFGHRQLRVCVAQPQTRRLISSYTTPATFSFADTGQAALRLATNCRTHS